jgi:hypothetical protein
MAVLYVCIAPLEQTPPRHTERGLYGKWHEKKSNFGGGCLANKDRTSDSDFRL